ncbi:MAG: serine/threonine-protein phosphatase [Lachnospiraceae bacterium]|nr:serine/threonine-protein phosphatase [Lachnospiraceae bacterium]
MNYIAAYHTDVGITKETNQDSLAIKIVETNKGPVAFGIVCDGMGGLSKGELASKEVTLAFCEWFENTLLDDIQNGSFTEERLVSQWNELVQLQNKKLGAYGEENHLQLGTTISAILMIGSEYYIVHVGDSRVYQFTKKVNQLTHDQTFVAREIAAGRMTPRQAKTDPRRNVLLQCVGASSAVEPEFAKGNIERNAVYMICSDGFRHQISEDEMLAKIGPDCSADAEKMKFGCMYLTELIKSRNETDNITVALIRTI